MTGMVGLAAELAAHAERHGPVTVGLAGAGQMGNDIVMQVGLMPGVRIDAMSELRMQNAIDAILMSGRERGDIVDASSAADIDRAAETNRVAVTADYKALRDAAGRRRGGAARGEPWPLHAGRPLVRGAVAARGAVDLDALVLIAPAGLGPEINRGSVDGFLAAASDASMTPRLKELFADPSLVTPAFVRLSLRAGAPALDGLRRMAAAVFPDGTQAFSVRADLARVACPVRVIVGTADRIIPTRHAEALPGLVALHRLPGIGHRPQIEAREAVQAIIAQASHG